MGDLRGPGGTRNRNGDAAGPDHGETCGDVLRAAGKQQPYFVADHHAGALHMRRQRFGAVAQLPVGDGKTPVADRYMVRPAPRGFLQSGKEVLCL